MEADFISKVLKSVYHSHRCDILLAKMSSQDYLTMLTDVWSILNDQVSGICGIRWEFVNFSHHLLVMGTVMEIYELVAMLTVDSLICCLIQIYSLVFSV